MRTIYVLSYDYCWGYEDRGSEVLNCFCSEEQAEQAAYWLNEERADWDKMHESYNVYEVNLV